MRIARTVCALLLLSIGPAQSWAQRGEGPPPTSVAPTIVAGRVEGVWTEANSPYLVVDDLVVDRLLIRAGVTVLVDPGVVIRVRGALNVTGGAFARVVFTSRFAGRSWGGLEFDSAAAPSTLVHCRVERSSNSGVRIVDSTVTLDRCLITNNRAPIEGGGILALNGAHDLTLIDCEITNNTAGREGGGLSASLGSGALLMRSCVIGSNHAVGELGTIQTTFGGGINVVDAAAVELENCLIASNTLTSTDDLGLFSGLVRGGGLRVIDAPLSMLRCIVRGNSIHARSSVPNAGASAEGAGVYIRASGHSAILRNCLISDNFAFADSRFYEASAGVGIDGGFLQLTNCTVARNTTRLGQFWNPSLGGPGATGILAQGSSVLIENSIVYENDFICSFGCFPAPAQLSGSGITVRYSDIENGFAGTGNIAVAPLFSGGGPFYGDLSLSAPSPCVDAGSPDPRHDDVAFPPSLGTARNDMGMNGGPEAGGWLNWP